MIQKAQKLANLTYSVIEKSCNKLLIGKTFWKNVALPSILYGTNIINLTDTELNKLQTIENGVYRKILGAPKYAPNCTLRGEVGSSLMAERVINGRIQYMKRTITGDNELLKRIMEEMVRYQDTGWMKATRKSMTKVDINMKQVREENKEQLKETGTQDNGIKKWDQKVHY